MIDYRDSAVQEPATETVECAVRHDYAAMANPSRVKPRFYVFGSREEAVRHVEIQQPEIRAVCTLVTRTVTPWSVVATETVEPSTL